MARRATAHYGTEKKVDLDEPTANLGTRAQERDPGNFNRFAHGLEQNTVGIPQHEAPFDVKIEGSPPHQDLASTGFVGATVVGKGRLRHRVRPPHGD